MKVLHLAPGNLFGGIETLLVTFAQLRHLCPQMEPHLGVCFPGRVREELTAAGVPVHALGAVRVSRPWTVLRARWRLKRVIRDHGIKVAVTHGMWPHAVFGPAVRGARARLANFVHGELTGRHLLDRWAARTRPDAVVTNSRFTAQSAAALFPRVLVKPVYLPLSRPDIDHVEARRAVRQELGTPNNATVILQASRLERWKGQAVHVEALGRLKDMTGWEAWFAGGAQKPGEGEFLAELKATVERLGIAGQVKFLGQRTDVSRSWPPLMFIASRTPDQSLSACRSSKRLYAGLPVVSSNTGGAAEIVTPECGLCALRATPQQWRNRCGT